MREWVDTVALSPWRIAVIYAVVGSLWILGSDYLVLFLVPSGGATAVVQSIKGALFVAVSAVVIWTLTAQWAHQRDEQVDDLQAEEERYERLFVSIQDAIIVVDDDQRVVDVNPAFTDLFGYDRETIEGLHVRTLFAEETAYNTLKSLVQGRTDDPVTETLTLRTRAGTSFPGETTVFALTPHTGDTDGFVGLIRDVSGRKRRTRQLQVLDRVLRHNLRNDMNLIAGAAESITEPGDESIEEYTALILDTSAGLLDTVEKERKITQLLSDPPRRRELDLVPPVEEVVADARRLWPDASIDVSVPERCTVYAIPAIGDAIEELVSNAIEHADVDNPKVTVRLLETDTHASIEVVDEGPGIPVVERGVLTGEAEMTQLTHSAGLGLWFVDLVAHAVGGSIDIEANSPQGSIVKITLDRPKDRAEHTVQTPTPA